MALPTKMLSGRDTISTKDTMLTMTYKGQIIPLMEINKFTAKWEKNKEDIQTLGQHVKMKKTTSVEGTGTLGGYWINSNWIKFGVPYVQGGEDVYFSITFTIEDPTSSVGRQVVQLDYVNLDTVPIADFEVDDGVMEWETDFTFEDSHLVQEFKGLKYN